VELDSLELDSLETETRFDLAIVSKRRSMRISPQGVRSLIHYLSGNGLVGPAFEERMEGWSEVFAKPGDFAHALFHTGESTGIEPAYYELAVRFGDTPLTLGYGVEEPVRWFLEIRGAAFAHVTDDFLERVHSVFYAHPEVVVRRFTALRGREGTPADDTARRRRETGPGLAGVRIEEY